jgi:hypothetical protein
MNLANRVTKGAALPSEAVIEVVESRGVEENRDQGGEQ